MRSRGSIGAVIFRIYFLRHLRKDFTPSDGLLRRLRVTRKVDVKGGGGLDPEARDVEILESATCMENHVAI